MTVTAQHITPIGKTDTVDTWRKSMRISVPSRDGHIVGLIIVRMYETTAVNGLPLDLLIDARKTHNDPVKQFGVVFGSSPPDWPAYDIPVLWQREGVGRWR
ncbi:MAG: hypothetical protein V7742_21300 [Halioglobus sp.]